MSMRTTRARLVTGVLVAGALAAPAAARAANGDFRNASAQQQLAVDKARAFGWSTRTLTEQLDACRHDRAWHGDLLASR